MKQTLRRFFVLLALLLPVAKSYSQNTSNKGKEFWLGYGNHSAGYRNMSQEMAIYATSDVNTSVTLEIPGISYRQSYQVTANSITVIPVPDAAYLADQGKYDLGIHVTADRPVVLYAHIYDRAVSGATLVLPVNTLGREYYSINYQQISNDGNARSYFFVVATEDNTEVEIIPSADTEGDAAGAWPAGTLRKIKLNKGEIYQVLGKTTGRIQIGTNNAGNPIYDYTGVDLSGSVIRSVSTGPESCKRIAVFSGSGKIAVGCNTRSRSSDNFYQQLYPTAAWGKNFITVPLKQRNYDIIRIIKSKPEAVVKVDGSVIAPNLFTNNFYYEFSTVSTHSISSDQPIQVVQYAVTQDQMLNCGVKGEPYGDPEMIFLNPIEQNIEKITVYSSPYFDIQAHFINVIIDASAASGFTLDGLNYGSAFQPVPSDPRYAYAQLSVTDGVHTLTADKGFNAIAYGFGIVESYGYSAGTNVKNLGLELISKVTNKTETGGCINEPFEFRLYLLNPTDKITWNAGDGSGPLIVNDPVPVGTLQRDDHLFYIYQYPNSPIVFNKAGDYSISATASKPLADGCGTTEDFATDFSIFNPPVADFAFTDTVCAGTTVNFLDKSNGNGVALKSWQWDFGDAYSTAGNPNTSSAQSPSHLFSKVGTFKVRLSVAAESSCSSQSKEAIVTVMENPVADFSVPFAVCEGVPASFTDKSSLASGSIVKWNWSFNDPYSSAQNPDSSGMQNPVHTFTKKGQYTVSLRVISAFGCNSVYSQTVNVGEVPSADFALPEVCLNDAYAEFEAIPGPGSDSDLSYTWNFGDDHSSASNPNIATGTRIRHRYSEAKVYDVSLTVSSANGCSSTLEKKFTVNGSTPLASFTISAPAVCSGQDIVFEDHATVDFGEITKIEWYLNGNSEYPDFVDETPDLRNQPPHRYHFSYPVFHSPASQTVYVRMKAYSGTSCLAETEQPLLVKAVPELVFDSIPPLCADAGPVKLVQGREIHGVLAGTETYSGKGVSKNGFFYPGRAGSGTHLISYTFLSDNGCPDTKTRMVTVYPSPVVDAGKEIVVLEGQEVQLNGSAYGFNPVLKWTASDPQASLSRDDILNPTCRPLENTTFTLTAISADGCQASSPVLVRVLKELKVANAITPNGDGKNDSWQIEHLNEYPGCTVDIYNRVGLRVFSSVGYGQPWDGTLNGKQLPEGTYYYIINPKNGRKAIAGNISILR